MLLRRIRADVDDALVQGEERRPPWPTRSRMRASGAPVKAFHPDRVGLVASCAQIVDQFSGKILVQLDLHTGRSGKRLSSRASSAAIAVSILHSGRVSLKRGVTERM